MAYFGFFNYVSATLHHIPKQFIVNLHYYYCHFKLFKDISAIIMRHYSLKNATKAIKNSANKSYSFCAYYSDIIQYLQRLSIGF
jgi:hypothetical protein